nr:hypothetical protein [Desulfosarcina cetonica]
MKLILRMILTGFFILCTMTGAHAAVYDFNGTWVDVEAWAGIGANETILVVDWNKLDQEANGKDILSESHAFGFRWDGTAYESDMLTAFNDAGILIVDTGYGGAFVNNIGYWDEEDNEVTCTSRRVAGTWPAPVTPIWYGVHGETPSGTSTQPELLKNCSPTASLKVSTPSCGSAPCLIMPTTNLTFPLLPRRFPCRLLSGCLAQGCLAWPV